MATEKLLAQITLNIPADLYERYKHVLRITGRGRPANHLLRYIREIVDEVEQRHSDYDIERFFPNDDDGTEYEAYVESKIPD